MKTKMNSWELVWDWVDDRTGSWPYEVTLARQKLLQQVQIVANNLAVLKEGNYPLPEELASASLKRLEAAFGVVGEDDKSGE